MLGDPDQLEMYFLNKKKSENKPGKSISSYISIFFYLETVHISLLEYS